MPRELMSSDEAHAHWATAAAARGAAEDVHTGAPVAVNEPAVAALTHVKHTVGKLFHNERPSSDRGRSGTRVSAARANRRHK